MNTQHLTTLTQLKLEDPKEWDMFQKEIIRFSESADNADIQLACSNAKRNQVSIADAFDEAALRFREKVQLELLNSFSILNLSLCVAELKKLSSDLILSVRLHKQGNDFSIPIGEYTQRVQMILNDLEEISVGKEGDVLLAQRRVKSISFDCISEALSLWERNRLEESSCDETNDYEELLLDLVWQDHFKSHLPPKYEGVKSSGKALKFFLEWYRGKTIDFTPHPNGRLDYVDLGLRQVDVRRYDIKLMRALENHFTYSKGDHQLAEILPPSNQSIM